jgi:hypothetical protein
MVSRPVCRGIKHPSGGYDQNYITVRQLRVSWCEALSLMRGRVCRLQLLLVLASAVTFGSEFRGTRYNILLSEIRDFLLRLLQRLAELRWRYSTPPPHGRVFTLLSTTLKSYITTDGQSASVSSNKAPIWGLRPDFYYCQKVAALNSRNAAFTNARRTEHRTPNPTVRVSVVVENAFVNATVTQATVMGTCLTKPLASNGRSLWLHYSGFQASCHNMM